MLELFYMSLLGIAYTSALIKESKEEKEQQEKERIRNLKIKVFCYAVRHRLEYDDVVEALKNKTLTLDNLDQ